MLTVAQGGTVRLPAVFRDASNALVDPGSPALEIMNENGITVESGLVPVRESIGEYHYDYLVASDANLGVWTGRFTGTIDGATVAGDETFSVVIPGYVDKGWLISLDRLLDALDKVPGDMEAYEIEKYEGAISSASSAIRNYTDREFLLNTSSTLSTRTIEYDDSGYIDIPDAQLVSSVVARFDYGADLPYSPSQYRLMPFDAPVKDTLILSNPLLYGMSPEMGFTWNLDRYDGPVLAPVLEITGVFGWPEIPEDVQQAAVWTATAFAEEEKSVSSENISSFGRSYAVRSASAIPLRARELLDQYKRISV